MGVSRRCSSLLVGQQRSEGELLSLHEALVKVVNRLTVLLECLHGFSELILKARDLQSLVLNDFPLFLNDDQTLLMFALKLLDLAVPFFNDDFQILNLLL